MNSLKKIKEFENVLKNYHVSSSAQKVLNETKVVLCDAATAAGRNTVINELLKTDKYYYIVSDTTRKPRKNNGVLEENGKVYWFRTEEEMLDDLKAGKLVEAEIIHKQQVSGISIREIAVACDLDKIAITDVDRIGVKSVRSVKSDAICLFFIPPSYEIWQQRLKERGNMDPQEYERRMQTAILEYENALKNDFYYFVINNELDETVKAVDKIIHGEVEEKYQQNAREIASNILSKLNSK